MIDDPNAPGYRMPEAGERVWHTERQEAGEIARDQGAALSADEVRVEFDSGRFGIVRLKNLQPFWGST